MTLRAFAERILFASSLEEKLAPPPGILTDDAPGQALAAPPAPGRPADLQFVPSGSGSGSHFPKVRGFDTDAGRGMLLHFFANHELLATELMALALLKFPDADPAFRRGLLKTLRDEQEHTRLYIERMADCGVTFGQHPVNGFFWRCIADMPSPLDYVARLSLTFEQANLDFSLHFSRLFGEAGDPATAALLQRIYRDEIAHVSYGLKWFRRWKGARMDDWQAFCQALAFPLSPARAKGTVAFNAEGRRRAGLDETFIDNLRLFSQSRGRTPWVCVFNPGAESAAAACDASAAESDAATRKLARDLDTLSFFQANSEDVVLLRRRPRQEFLHSLHQIGFRPPEWELLDANGQLDAHSTLRTRKLGRLRPWGWSADSHAVLAPLFENARAETNPAAAWNENVRKLYSKSHSAALLEDIPWQDAFGGKGIIGVPCASAQEARHAVQELWKKGRQAVVKGNFGIAGRRMLRLPPGEDMSPVEALCGDAQGAMVEPWLDRVADFSAHFECDPGAPPRFKGLVRLHCTAAGKFVGCAASHSFSRLLPPEVARFAHSTGSGWLKAVFSETVAAALERWLSGTGFRGMLGIDCFFYRDETGSLRLKPVVEVNPRSTMGRLTLDLRDRLAPSRSVMFRIFSLGAARRAGCKSLEEFAARLQTRFPIVLQDGKVASGAFFINDPAAAEQFLGCAVAGAAPLDPETVMM